MGDLRDELHRVGIILAVGQLHESDQLAPIVGPQELALVPIRLVQPPDVLEHLVMMREGPALPDGGLVVNRRNSPDEGVIEIDESDFDTTSLGPSDRLARALAELVLQPVSVALDRKNRNWLSLPIIRILGLWIRGSLPETEEVGVQRGVPHCLHERFWVVDVLMPFLFDPDYPHQPTLDDELPTLDSQRFAREASWPSRIEAPHLVRHLQLALQARDDGEVSWAEEKPEYGRYDESKAQTDKVTVVHLTPMLARLVVRAHASRKSAYPQGPQQRSSEAPRFRN